MSHSPAVHFEIYGRGFPLLLGYPLTASLLPEDPEGSVRRGYLDRLVDRYRVVVMDYPNLRGNERFPADELTAERVCADMLRVADAAGFHRFAWWGYSWGGVVGLQLAARTERVAALVCGGWSPLGNLYPDVLNACKATLDPLDQHQQQYVTFYESIQAWPEESAVERMTCARMAYAGAADDIKHGGVQLSIATTLRANRLALERGGWHVTEIPGRDHSVWMDPAVVVPIVRPFLDQAVHDARGAS